MSRTKCIISLLAAIFILSGFANIVPQQQQRQQNSGAAESSRSDKPLVDYKADVIKQLAGDSIIRLVGDVVLHHNGAIVQCDSAFKYQNDRFECFGRVLINQDSTNIYGDRALYDGETNSAKVFAPLIKMTNGTQTVMYTYTLTFNTQTSVGEFGGGAIVRNGSNFMESERGMYYSNVNEIKLLDSVKLRNEDYKVKTDSLKFNMDTELVTFLSRTYIWDKERDFLTSKSGTYDTKQQVYTFTEEAYMLTKDQECWADSIIYESLTREALMRRNIQILDTAQQTIAFGDWGYYNDSIKKAILTCRPSVRSWEKDGDTAYMRADSIFFETHPRGTTRQKEQEPDSMAVQNLLAKTLDGVVKNKNSEEHQTVDTVDGVTTGDSAVIDIHSKVVNDSVIVDNKDIDDVDSIVVREADVINTVGSDTMSIVSEVEDSVSRELFEDRLFEEVAKDSISRDSLAVRSTVAVSDTVNKSEQDTTERLLRAFREVQIFRKDFQAACDSLVGYSVDSTMSMFGSPVLWNEENQITSEQIDAYTKNEEMDWADFIGNPFIAQRVDTVRFNQASGKKLNAFFKNNEIEMTLLQGNVINYYYMDEDKEVVSFATIESAELEMYFVERQPQIMKWIDQSTWAIYPIDKIPEKQPQRLDGFKWVTKGRATTAAEICNRVVRETLRVFYSAIPRPVFSLEEKILAYRDELIKEERWKDRTDQPTYTPEYFKSESEFDF